MKHTVAIILPLSNIPESAALKVPIAWDKDGNATHYEKKERPAFVSKRKVTYYSNGKQTQGWLTILRKMEITVPPPTPPQ